MSIDFATLQGLTIPEGVVTQITDASGRVLWMLPVAGGPVVLEVEKITSDTYAGSTAYTGESFVLLNIYPKTNGTVTVTYGGVTKTVVDTSGAESPNAQQVFFGTFNGVPDGVETPASGELVIDGDIAGFSLASYSIAKSSSTLCDCITSVVSFGEVDKIVDRAFSSLLYGGSQKITSIKIPSTIKTIGADAFYSCSNLASVVISNGVTNIGDLAFSDTSLQRVTLPASVKEIGVNPFRIAGDNIISVSDKNLYYKVDSNCLIEMDTNRIISGFSNSAIPPYITSIATFSFMQQADLTSITIPASVKLIGNRAFEECTNLNSAVFENQFGWYTGTEDATEGQAVNVRNASEAAKELAITKISAHWHHTSEPFSFEISLADGTVFSSYGIYGTTWSEWVASEYNTVGMVVVGNTVQSPDGLWLSLYSSDYSPVGAQTLIKGDGASIYYLSTVSTGTFTFTLAGDEWTAEYGMTWLEFIESDYNSYGNFQAEDGGYVHNPMYRLKRNGNDVYSYDFVIPGTYTWG